MIKSITSFFYILIASIVSYTTAYKEDKGGEKNLKQEITEYILHHVQDSHDFGLLSYKDKKQIESLYWCPLPIIIYDKGFKFFMSSKFDHGRKVAKIEILTMYYIMIRYIRVIRRERLAMMVKAIL